MSQASNTAVLTPAADTAATRQRRSKQQRRQIVEETFLPGASVARVARAHGVNANQVFYWRQLYQRGLLDSEATTTTLLPVRIEEAPPALLADAVPPTPSSITHAAPTGTIHVECNRARLRIEGAVDPHTLGLVLEHLLA